MIATGAEYRRPPLENLSRFEGAGVYYGATFVEAQLCAGEEVIVVGGGNAAGQAAVFLAQITKRVHMLVRSTGLAESMSLYLIRRIEETATIVFRPYTEIVALEEAIISNPFAGETVKPGKMRSTRSATCSSWPAPIRTLVGSMDVSRSTLKAS